jgi:hypothetical protein
MRHALTFRARSWPRDIPSGQYKEAAQEGYPWLDGLNELRNLTWVDLPTSHWPMWSRPQELAEIIGDVAKAASKP